MGVNMSAAAIDIDHRDLDEVIAYQEARIEALERRIRELYAEIRELKSEQ